MRGGSDSIQLILLFNTAPVLQYPLNDTIIFQNDPGIRLDLTALFADPDNQELHYSYSIDNENIVRCILGLGILQIIPLSAGETEVLLTAYDTHNANITRSLGVSILKPDKVREVAYSSQKFQVSVFPNPGSDQLTIRFDAFPHIPCWIHIVDVSGRLVFAHDFWNTEKGPVETTVNTSEFNPGIYSIQVFSETEILHTEKVIIR